MKPFVFPCLAFLLVHLSAAAEFPQAEISNSLLRAKLYLPDASQGYYRGTRFDWSGVIGSLEYAGHNYYPQWFQRSDPKVHDFIYDGAEIVAGPCTAITGPAEEFATNGKGLGFDQTKADEGANLRLEIAGRVRDEVVKALSKIHALLDTEQRSRLAYLIRTGTIVF